MFTFDTNIFRICNIIKTCVYVCACTCVRWCARSRGVCVCVCARVHRCVDVSGRMYLCTCVHGCACDCVKITY